MSKLLFFDLETTGVDYKLNAIHQLAGIIDIDGQVRGTFEYKVRPFQGAMIDGKALEIGNVTTEQILSYPPLQEAYEGFTNRLSFYVDKFNKQDKFHLVGYNNAPFDNQFLRRFFDHCGDKYFGSWFWADTIDVMCLASNHLRHERNKLPNFQLRTVAAYLGIPVDQSKLHDAIYDIELTRALFYKLK